MQIEIRALTISVQLMSTWFMTVGPFSVSQKKIHEVKIRRIVEQTVNPTPALGNLVICILLSGGSVRTHHGNCPWEPRLHLLLHCTFSHIRIVEKAIVLLSQLLFLSNCRHLQRCPVT